MKTIKLLVMDVDGTMTDGKINMGASGEVFKSFDIKDGYGIHEILPANGIKSAIITGRVSEIVKNRAKELEIDYVCQGIKDKIKKLHEIMEDNLIGLEEIAYIGDDMMDRQCMEVCGAAGCPADAVEEVKEISAFISKYAGGCGAVREFIEWIVERNRRCMR